MMRGWEVAPTLKKNLRGLVIFSKQQLPTLVRFDFCIY